MQIKSMKCTSLGIKRVKILHFMFIKLFIKYERVS